MKDYVVPLGQSLWSGVSPAAAPGEVRWELAKSGNVKIEEVPHDWSAYNTIAVTVSPSKPSASRVSVAVSWGSKTAPVPLNMDFAGLRTFEIPFCEFGGVGQEVQWDKIDALSFSAEWVPQYWNERKVKPDPTVVLTISDIRLRAGAKAKGPRMSDRELFEALDLEWPGLEQVKDAVVRGDVGGARHALAEHLRTHTSPHWFEDPRRRPTLGMSPVTARAEQGKGGRFVAKVSFDAGGWQHIVLPRSAFEEEDHPHGWGNVSGLRLEMAGEGDAGLVIYLDDVRLSGPGGAYLISDFEREPVGWTGLALSDEQARHGRQSGKWWFTNITPAVRCQAAPRDWSGFDALDFWVYAVEPSGAEVVVVADSDAPDTSGADMILAHKFAPLLNVIFDFGPRIDWASNPMSEGETTNIQWTICLNRHLHFAFLRRAYWETGDEKYAKELADEIVGWIEDCPPLRFHSGSWSPHWHHAWAASLEPGIRMAQQWPDVFYDCLLSPSFTDDVLVTMVKSMADHARYLVRWPASNNSLTVQCLGLYTVGTILPEFKEARSWRRIALGRLYKQLEDEIYPDGLEYELALGYNLWMLSEYIRVIEIARLNDAVDELPAGYQARIEKMFNYLMYDCMPDGVAVGLNDSGSRDVRAILIEGYRYFPHRHDFAYVATNGRQGQAPVHTSYAFSYAGHYIMRSGWGRDARMLHFDAGPFGFIHQHEDKLHFIVYAFGKQLLLESGGYTYDASRWRRYVLSTRGHNTVLLDGEGQNRRRQANAHVWPRPWDAPSPPTDTRFVTTSGFDYAIGFYKDGYGPQMDKSVTHTRQIFFVKPDYWIVLDRLNAADEKIHTCDSFFHIAAADAVVDPETKAVTTSEKGEANLAIVPIDDPALKATIVKGTTEEPVQGWSSERGPWRPVPTAIFSREWTGAAQLLYVVHPVPAGEAVTPPAVKSLAGAQDGCVVCIDRAGHPKASFLAQARGGTPMQADDVSTDAEAAFVCMQAGDDFCLALVQGTRLRSGACGLAFSNAVNASLEGRGGAYLLDYAGDAPDVCEVGLPECKGKADTQVYRLGRNLDRQEAVKAEATNEEIRFAVEPHSRYEIAFGASKVWKEVKVEKSETAKRRKR